MDPVRVQGTAVNLTESKARRRTMRTLGYNDGVAGRKAKTLDADYQASWRRGQEARTQLGLPIRKEPQ